MRANLSKRRNIWSTNNFAFLQAHADGYIAVNCSSEDDGDDGGQDDDDDGGEDGGHGDDDAYLIFVISFTRAGISNSKFYT